MRKYLGKDDVVMYRPDAYHNPEFNAVDHLVSSVIVAPETTRSETVSVWSRGALTGSLTVIRGDGEKLAALLLGFPDRVRGVPDRAR